MQMLLLVQRPLAEDELFVDTNSAEQLARLTEASLALLELLLPRHVIEHLVLHADPNKPGDLSELATKHDSVTILFAGRPQQQRSRILTSKPQNMYP